MRKLVACITATNGVLCKYALMPCGPNAHLASRKPWLADREALARQPTEKGKLKAGEGIKLRFPKPTGD